MRSHSCSQWSSVKIQLHGALGYPPEAGKTYYDTQLVRIHITVCIRIIRSESARGWKRISYQICISLLDLPHRPFVRGLKWCQWNHQVSVPESVLLGVIVFGQGVVRSSPSQTLRFIKANFYPFSIMRSCTQTPRRLHIFFLPKTKVM